MSNVMSNVTDNRDKYIGGSDVSKIFSIEGNRFELIKEKAFDNKVVYDNDYMAYGREMEPKIRDYINSTNTKGFNFKPDTLFIEPLHIRANLDGIDYDKGYVLEIKTGSSHRSMLENKAYLLQIYFYLKVANMSNVILATYERDDDFDITFNEVKLNLHYLSKEQLELWLKDVIKKKQFFDYIKEFWDDVEKVKLKKVLYEVDLLPTTVKDLSMELRRIEQKKFNLENEISTFKEKLYNEMEKYDIKNFKLHDGTSITRVLPSTSVRKTLKKDVELPDEYYDKKEIKKKGYVKITLGK